MNRTISIPAKDGELKAVVLPDDEYPAISLVYSAPENAEPGVVLEWDKNQNIIRLRIWKDGEGDPT